MMKRHLSPEQLKRFAEATERDAEFRQHMEDNGIRRGMPAAQGQGTSRCEGVHGEQRGEQMTKTKRGIQSMTVFGGVELPDGMTSACADELSTLIHNLDVSDANPVRGAVKAFEVFSRHHAECSAAKTLTEEQALFALRSMARRLVTVAGDFNDPSLDEERLDVATALCAEMQRLACRLQLAEGNE